MERKVGSNSTYKIFINSGIVHKGIPSTFRARDGVKLYGNFHFNIKFSFQRQREKERMREVEIKW